MRVVVDTNIFVSAALKSVSWPGMVIRWLDEFDGLLKTGATEGQVIDVLRRPYFASKLPSGYLDRVRSIFSKAEPVTILERITACRDPTDDKFLELAVNGRAEMIVTGDLDLLALHPFRGIPIITPMAFIHAHARAG
jgi:putative PIN family toxin of toxin-antitoxin system